MGRLVSFILGCCIIWAAVSEVVEFIGDHWLWFVGGIGFFVLCTVAVAREDAIAAREQQAAVKPPPMPVKRYDDMSWHWNWSVDEYLADEISVYELVQR